MRGDADTALTCRRFGVKMRGCVGSDGDSQHRQNRRQCDQGLTYSSSVTRVDQGFFFC